MRRVTLAFAFLLGGALLAQVNPFREDFRAACGPRALDRVAQSYVESGWNPRAVSPVGARGLLQAMPKTWGWYEVRGWVPRGASPFDPPAAIRGGHAHMVYLERYFDGDQVKAWAAFNCGQENVNRAVRLTAAMGLPPDAWLQVLHLITKQNAAETRGYVLRIPAVRARLARRGW